MGNLNLKYLMDLIGHFISFLIYLFSGCELASSHVWRGILYEISGQHKDLDGFAKTRVPRNRAQPSDGNYGVYGIDGEMLFTTHGLQLCKGG